MKWIAFIAVWLVALYYAARLGQDLGWECYQDALKDAGKFVFCVLIFCALLLS